MLVLSSGTDVVAVKEIKTPSGPVILPGDGAMVIGISSAAGPMVYLCETTDPMFEPEEFFAFENEIVAVAG